MNRPSIYDDLLYAYLDIPNTPISKRQLGKQLINPTKEAEVWEPVTCTKYMVVTEALAALSGLSQDSRYYFYRDGVMEHSFWNFVTLVHRRWWLRYAATAAQINGS